MRKNFILLVFVLSFLIVLTSVSAGSLVTVTEVTNVNGSVGLQIKNEQTVNIYPNAEAHNKSYLNFTSGGAPLSILPGSTTQIGAGRSGLVILNQTWPTSNFTTIDIRYTDGVGGTYNEVEQAIVFAVPGLSKVDSSVDQESVLSDGEFTLRLTLGASGETNVEDIQIDRLALPQYFKFMTQSVHTSIAKGELKEFVFSYDSSGGFPDTVIYTTVHVPIKVIYKYHDKTTSQTFNESVLVFNTDASAGEAPTMNVNVEKQSTVEQGKTGTLSAYVWNNNLGGHAACNVSVTLSTTETGITFPVSTIIPRDQFDPGNVTPADPVAEFTIQTTTDTSLGLKTLTLETKYADCTWKQFSKTLTETIEFEVIEPVVTALPQDDPIDVVPLVVSPTPVEPKDGDEGEGSALKVILFSAFIALLVIFGTIYVFNVRARRI